MPRQQRLAQHRDPEQDRGDRDEEGDQAEVRRPRPREDAEEDHVGQRRGQQRHPREARQHRQRPAPAGSRADRPAAPSARASGSTRSAAPPPSPAATLRGRGTAGPTARRSRRKSAATTQAPCAVTAAPTRRAPRLPSSPRRRENPPPTPAARAGVSRSSRVSACASSTVKSGVLAFRIAATPEAIWVWLQTNSVKGTALFRSPIPRKAASTAGVRGGGSSVSEDHRPENRGRENDARRHHSQRRQGRHRHLVEEERPAPQQRQNADQPPVGGGHAKVHRRHGRSPPRPTCNAAGRRSDLRLAFKSRPAGPAQPRRGLAGDGRRALSGL